MIFLKYSFVSQVKDPVSNNLNYFLHCHEINYEFVLNTYIFTCLSILNLIYKHIKIYIIQILKVIKIITLYVNYNVKFF